MQEGWARLWQRVVREMKHSKAIIQKDKPESERTRSNIFCAWHQMFWKEGEVCFVPPAYKLFCEYLQGVSATDEWCWSVGLRLWGLTLLIKGGSQCARSAEGMTARKGMESKGVHTDAVEKGDGKQSGKIIPVAAVWRGHQAPSLQHLTLIRFEISSETARATQLYPQWGRRLCGMLWLSQMSQAACVFIPGNIKKLFKNWCVCIRPVPQPFSPTLGFTSTNSEII